jgi:hypothetical protein
MRRPAIFLALIFTTAAVGQYRGNPTPVFQGFFGNVVFPGGVSGMPGVTRFIPNVVYPAGNPPQLNVPYSAQNSVRLGQQYASNRGFATPVYGRTHGGFRAGSVAAIPYAVPVYIGGYAGYTGYYDSPPPPDVAGAPAPGGSSPNVVVVYPAVVPGGAPPPSGGYGEAYAPPTGAGPSQPAPASEQGNANPAPTYLIAFKDHTIYSAVAYWVEGDTLHYFTSGSNHNQVSLSLVDRDLTLRLNQEAGNNMQLPNN